MMTAASSVELLPGNVAAVGNRINARVNVAKSGAILTPSMSE
jgi:hypothetical protein